MLALGGLAQLVQMAFTLQFLRAMLCIGLEIVPRISNGADKSLHRLTDILVIFICLCFC